MGIFDRMTTPTIHPAEQAAAQVDASGQWVVPESAQPRRGTLSPAERDEALALLLERLGEIGGGARQALVDNAWGGIPLTYWESQYSASGLQVVPQPKSENGVTITTIVACVASGATGLVQLADVVLPVSPGTTVIPFGPGSGIQLQRGDTRSLTQTSAGPLSLLLAGHVAPMYSRVQ